MTQNGVDAQPTNAPEEALLKVLNRDERTKKIAEARHEGRIKTATKITVRAITFNSDVFLLAICIFLAGLVGFSLARLSGLTPQEITSTVEDYIYFFVYIIFGVMSAIAKLASKSGLISQTLQAILEEKKQQFAEWIKDITTPKTELKWNVLTTQNSQKEGERKMNG